MDKLIELFNKLPRFMKVLLVSLLFLILCVAFIMFLMDGKKEKIEKPKSVILSAPAPTVDSLRNESKLDSFDKSSHLINNSTDDYFDKLNGNSSVSVLPVSGENSATATANNSNNEYLDPSIYSELDIQYIRSGAKTKEQVDKEHEEDRKYLEELNNSSNDDNKELSSAQQDSLMMARAEKMYKLMSKYSGTPNQPTPNYNDYNYDEEGRKKKKEERYIPTNTFQTDDIISSLSSSNVDTSSEDISMASPAKATFLKTEQVMGGQRIIMRLMQDLRLSDGTVIPANTHITGICSLDNRLKIDIVNIQYAGKMFHTKCNVYDTDGVEGIYCPVLKDKKGNEVKQEMVSQAASNVASLATTLFTGNPYLGQMANTGINGLTRTSNEEGTPMVNIRSGYEFYVFEMPKKDNK